MGISYSKYDNIENGIVVLNNKKRIIYANKSALISPNLDLVLKEKNTIPMSFNRKMIVLPDYDENLYKDFFDNSEQMLCISSISSSFIRINSHMHEILGYSQKEMMEMNFTQLIHPDDLNFTCSELYKIQESQKPGEFTNRYRKKDGSYIVLSWKVHCIHKNIFSFATDMTETLKTQEINDTNSDYLRYAEMLSQTGLWSLDIGHSLFTCNKGILKIYCLEDIPSYTEFLSLMDPDFENVVDQCLKSEDIFKMTAKISTISGVKYLNMILFTRNKKLLCVVQDITKRTIDSQVLKQLKEYTYKLKSSFLSNINHELRTPIHGIMGIVGLLKLHSIDEKHKKYISILESSSNDLIEIINNMLDYSKIEQNKSNLEVSNVNLLHFINTIIQSFKLNAETKGLVFTEELDETLDSISIIDTSKLKCIVFNLLSNSLKFTKKGNISLKAYKKNNRLFLSVQDSGIGIDKSRFTDIFEPFTQEDISTTKNYGGSGLGLSICKSYVLLMNGNITFKSEKNKGCIFTVVLPAG